MGRRGRSGLPQRSFPTAFLAAEAPLRGAAAVVHGVPYDGGISFRAGAAGGPAAIRELSDSLETYSPATGRDLEDLAVHDAGDLSLAGLDAPAVMERIAGATERLAAFGALLVTLGGDHSISIGTSRGLRRIYPDLAHLVVDAHMDLRPEYDGSVYSHACGTRHMSEDGPTVLLGVRSGSRPEWEEAEKRLVAFSAGLSLPEPARRALEGRPVHLSLDLDVLDASVLPGTGNPEPGGPTYRELADALLGLTGLRLVAIDLTEVSPALDPTGVSALIAAKLARDIICSHAGR